MSPMVYNWQPNFVDFIAHGYVCVWYLLLCSMFALQVGWRACRLWMKIREER
jgi:hypothetical protein